MWNNSQIAARSSDVASVNSNVPASPDIMIHRYLEQKRCCNIYIYFLTLFYFYLFLLYVENYLFLESKLSVYY